jgi:glycopeptide antibiotics resistance protein
MIAPPSLHALPRARPTLGGTLLAYVTATILVITLTPFQLRWPEGGTLAWYSGSFDLTVNVVLFVPVGFLFGLGAFSMRRPLVGATLAGLALSGFIECAQLFIEGRYTSPLDLATNTLGALLGAGLYRALRGALHRRLAERLSLELPLMALFYLLVPLAWLHGLVAFTHPSRAYLGVLCVLFGAYLFGAVYHHRLRPSGVLGPHGFVTALQVVLVGPAEVHQALRREGKRKSTSPSRVKANSRVAKLLMRSRSCDTTKVVPS